MSSRDRSDQATCQTVAGRMASQTERRQQQKLVQPLRSRKRQRKQLDFETLPRLDAFLKAESDTQYEPSQRTGGSLPYSAWVLGPANAIPDLDQAIRVWDARNTVLEYLRSDDPSLDVELIKKLQSTESISPNVVLNLTAQLPPIIDSSDIEPGTLISWKRRTTNKRVTGRRFRRNTRLTTAIHWRSSCDRGLARPNKPSGPGQEIPTTSIAASIAATS